MTYKTVQEVQAEITALKELLPQMPNYKRGINVPLRVLEEPMSHDAVFDAFEGDELFDDAHIASLWRDGHGGSAPSVQFREMI
jgi:hypothetical protein